MSLLQRAGVGPYSNSRLSAFENCPRQFEYRYVQKIPTTTESIEAFLGKRVHELLERLYHHVHRYRRPPSLAQVLERFRKDWDREWHDDVEVIKSDLSVDDYQQRGDRCLENYYRAHYPFDHGETIGVEERISLALDDEGRYRARGIVDRIVRSAPGHYEIHDYKTGSYVPPQKRLDGDRQLALYQIGLEQRLDDVESVELVWHYLLFNKTLRSRRTPEQLEQLRGDTIRLIDRIENAEEFPPRPGPLCRWCEYRELCADAALPAPFEEPPPPSDHDAPPLVVTPGAPAPGARAAVALAPRSARAPIHVAEQLPLL